MHVTRRAMRARQANLLMSLMRYFGLEGNGQKIMEKKYAQNYGKPYSSVTADDQAKSIPVYVNLLRWALEHNDGTSILSTDEKRLDYVDGRAVRYCEEKLG